jgi:hypothetical protein
MRFSSKAWIVLSAFFLSFVFVAASHAQFNSNTATVTLNAVLGESLTVNAPVGNVNFTPLNPNGITAGSAPVVITTTWALTKSGVNARTALKLYAGFTSNVALTDGAGDNIPTANFLGALGAGPFNAFTGAGGTALTVNGNALQIFALALGGAGTFNGTRNDTLNLEINTSGLALPAATYTGILTIQAQAT